MNHSVTIKGFLKRPMPWGDFFNRPMPWVFGIGVVILTASCSTAPKVAQPTDGLPPLTIEAEAAETKPPVLQPVASAIPADALSADRMVLAATFGHDKVVRYMLDHGVDPSAKDLFGNAGLIAAASAGQADIVGMLLNAKADVNAQTNAGHSALMGAVEKGDMNIVKALLKAGANVNARNNRNETALFPAVQTGNLRLVDTLLLAGAEINIANTRPLTSNDSGYTPLMYVARHGLVATEGPWADIARALLAKGADSNLRSHHGATALSIAERNGYVDIIDVLRGAGARKETVYTSLTIDDALIKASKNGDISKVRQLFTEGAQANVKNRLGVTPLLAAAMSGHTAIVQVLVEHDAKVNAVPAGLREWALSAARIALDEEEVTQAAARGDTALIIAVRQGHTDTVRYLLDHGADVNRANRQNESALFVAAELGQANIMRALLSKGADPNATEKENRTSSFTVALSTIGRNTVLIKAAQHGHAEVTQILLDAGALPNVSGFLGKTALFWTAERGHFGVAQVLLGKNADPNIKDVSGLTPLMVAAGNGNVKLVEALLQNKAEINAREGSETNAPGSMFGVSGATALIHAARAGHVDVVKILLRAGGDITATDSNGVNALKGAEGNGHASVVAVLKAAGT